MEFGFFSLAMPGVLRTCKTAGGGWGRCRMPKKPHVPTTYNISFKTDYCFLFGGRHEHGDKGRAAYPHPLPTKIPTY